MPDLKDLLFTGRRSHTAWLDRPVPDALLRELYDLVKMGPTSANNQAIRIVFVRTGPAKERVEPFLMPGNTGRVLGAPVTAIVGHALDFYEMLPRLYPVRPGTRDRVAGYPEPMRERMAFHSAALQTGYLILAARALGLDCGPMAGFDTAGVDREFFPEGNVRSSLLVNLGYGDADKLQPRLPRLDFDEACRLV